MPVFQCCGCPTGPCFFSTMDPEFIVGDECPANKGTASPNVAVWRELVVAE